MLPTAVFVIALKGLSALTVLHWIKITAEVHFIVCTQEEVQGRQDCIVCNTGLCVVLFQLKKQQQLQQQILLQHFQAQQAQLAEQHEQQLQQHLKVEVQLHLFVWPVQFIVTEVSEIWQLECRLSNQWTLLCPCKQDRVIGQLIGKPFSPEQ